MIVSRRTALLTQASSRIMRAAGRASSPEGRQAIAARKVDRAIAKLAPRTSAVPASHLLQS